MLYAHNSPPQATVSPGAFSFEGLAREKRSSLTQVKLACGLFRHGGHVLGIAKGDARLTEAGGGESPGAAPRLCALCDDTAASRFV